MSAIRCEDCGKFVSLEVEAEEENKNYDEATNKVEVAIQMSFTCAECSMELGYYSGKVEKIVPGLGGYLVTHSEVDPSVVTLDDIDIETNISKRKGRKVYYAEWSTSVKADGVEFPVNGELAVTQDEIDFE